MRSHALAAVALGAAVLMAAPAGVSRSSLSALELGFDEKIRSFDVNDPIDLIGATRGVYLEDYGVVFTAEVNLQIAALTPFRPKFTAPELETLRQKKLARLPDLRRLMREMLVSSAANLTSVAPDHYIVLGVVIYHAPWESTTGLPSQIVMKAKRGVLAGNQAGRAGPAGLAEAIREQVLY